MACAVSSMACNAYCILHLGCCEKQMNDARTIKYISNVLHAASRLKPFGLTVVEIALREQEPWELFIGSNHIQTILRLLQSLLVLNVELNLVPRAYQPRPRSSCVTNAQDHRRHNIALRCLKTAGTKSNISASTKLIFIYRYNNPCTDFKVFMKQNFRYAVLLFYST